MDNFQWTQNDLLLKEGPSDGQSPDSFHTNPHLISRFIIYFFYH